MPSAHPVLSKLRHRHNQLSLKLIEKNQHVKHLLQAATLGSVLLFSQPNRPELSPGTIAQKLKKSGFRSPQEIENQLCHDLASLLPTTPGTIDDAASAKITSIIKNLYGLKVTQELEGHRLNDSYGFIGSEQHLKRYPGDNLANHQQLLSAGMAPGLGAWGYFSHQSQLSPEDVLREQYYVAVQNMYTPEWSYNSKELIKWYKYRKVLVVNPQNGKAVVAVIADAGPASWTGKQFGGSPEVMHFLNLTDGKNRKKVLLWFIDGDAPLGPVNCNLQIGQSIQI